MWHDDLSQLLIIQWLWYHLFCNHGSHFLCKLLNIQWLWCRYELLQFIYKGGSELDVVLWLRSHFLSNHRSHFFHKLLNIQWLWLLGIDTDQWLPRWTQLFDLGRFACQKCDFLLDLFAYGQGIQLDLIEPNPVFL